MQFTKKYKHIISLAFILFLAQTSFSQETDSLNNESETDTLEVIKKEKGFFKKLFNKKKKDDAGSDTLNVQNENPPDSVPQKKFRLFKKDKNDTSSNVNSSGKPQKITSATWKNLNVEQQDSVLRTWDEYDKEYYKKKRKYSFTRKEIDIALSSKRNFVEKIIYERSRNKPFNYRKKLINRKNGRYKKAMRLEDLNKDIPIPEDTITDRNRYQLVRKQYRIQAKREAIRKNKVVIKFDKREDRLRRRYELKDEERKALNKGRGMKLKGAELIAYKKGRRKQEAFTEKLTNLRRERSSALQNRNAQTRLKKKNKVAKMKNRKKLFGDIFKRKKKRDDKYDSDEYPKRYYK